MKSLRIITLSFIGMSLLWSCGKPTNPETVVPPDVSGGYEIVGRYQTAGFAQDLVKQDNFVYIAQGEGGLVIVDVSDPENPQGVSVTTDNVRGYSSKIAVRDSVVYLAAGSFGVTAVNASDPSNPFVTASNLSMKPAKNLTVFGDYLFTAISEQGIKIAEIAYPTQPDIRGGTSTNGYARDIAITSDTNYMMVACGEIGLSMFDISDFQNGFGNYKQVGWSDTPGYAEAVILMDDQSIALMACGTEGLQIIDYSDTANVHIVGSYNTTGYAKDLVYKNQFVYLATELSGLQILDISDLTDPYIIGLVSTEYALGIDMDDDYIYVADDSEGLIVISIPN